MFSLKFKMNDGTVSRFLSDTILAVISSAIFQYLIATVIRRLLHLIVMTRKVTSLKLLNLRV